MTTTTQQDPPPLDDDPDYLTQLPRRAQQAHTGSCDRNEVMNACTRRVLLVVPVITALSESLNRGPAHILDAAARALNAIESAVNNIAETTENLRTHPALSRPPQIITS